jgi:hypothetical protein
MAKAVGLLGLGRATCGVSTGPTARLTGPVAQKRDLLWHGTTWEHSATLIKVGFGPPQGAGFQPAR